MQVVHRISRAELLTSEVSWFISAAVVAVVAVVVVVVAVVVVAAVVVAVVLISAILHRTCFQQLVCLLLLLGLFQPYFSTCLSLTVGCCFLFNCGKEVKHVSWCWYQQ